MEPTGFNLASMNYYYQSYGYYGRNPLPPVVKAILIACIAVFLAQMIVGPAAGQYFALLFGLSWGGIQRLFLWQLLTYQFLHGGLLHIFLNLLGLFFFGPDVERAIGSKRFAVLYLACGAIGGLAWLLISAAGPSYLCLGASGAVFGVLGAFAALFPDRPITLLVFFVLPVTMKARTMALALALASLLLMAAQAGDVAYAAHLAGGAAGYLAIALFHARSGAFIRPSLRQLADDLLWRWHRRKFKVVEHDPFEDDPGAEEPGEDEVNAVLEKLSKYGINSLTSGERSVLARASRMKAWRKRR